MIQIVFYVLPGARGLVAQREWGGMSPSRPQWFSTWCLALSWAATQNADRWHIRQCRRGRS